MKRFLFMMAVCAGLTGLVHAAPTCTLSKADLLNMQEVPPATGAFSYATDDLITYSNDNGMLGQVGFVGTLMGNPNGPISDEVWIGIPDYDLSSIDTYNLTLCNDNDDVWYVRLFVWEDTGGAVEWSDSWVPLNAGECAALSMDVDYASVDYIGIGIGGYRQDVFHVSACPIIPAPGAVLLAAIGTGLVGWMRRRRSL